ncbi:DUF4336 domain-containing protein [Aurantimonas endophytica]|uniref:DUF4336 domain-containing protein n=1 Tax=Aurantimonas endophytica TaxID=1522175 RepID=A0A7W6MR37_9HYPH|nr:DUF4336 domain-containing protein [Aurantimonas endophytica]MBB4004695.1 hypothetical protein [Aurantimonas endophytica]MCO6405512.1 DUF4336 domain-containing protein [Aurantimonas endophytica]
MQDEAILYPPLDVPKKVAEGIWIVDSGPIRPLGLRLPVRMTVIGQADGGLLLHSPTRFDAALKGEIEKIGRIAHLVAPNSAHWTFLKSWQEHVPDAVTWAAPGLRDRRQVRRSGVRLDRDIVPGAADWPQEIVPIIVPGIGSFAEVALFHQPSRTLVLVDLVQNLEPGKLPRASRIPARLAGVTAPHGRAPIYLRAVVRAKGHDAKAAARHIAALEPDRVIFSHGA